MPRLHHVGLRLSRRALVNLWRAPLPSLVAVLTIGLALFLGASFAFGLFAARSLLRSWGSQATLTMYLERNTKDAHGKELADGVQRLHPEMTVRFVPRGEALERLRADLGDQGSVLDGLPTNPLPPSIELVPKQTMSAAALRDVSADLQKLPGVAEVDYGRDWLDKLEALARALRAAGAGALVAVLGAALLVVANTIRLAVYARRDEIEIMKLVGATNGYVRLPFLLEGMLQGVLGAAVALLSLYGVQRWLLPRAQEAFLFASGVTSTAMLRMPQIAVVATAGAVVGLLGSWLAVSRFLRA